MRTNIQTLSVIAFTQSYNQTNLLHEEADKNQKTKTVSRTGKRVKRGKRGFGWASSADSEPQTRGS
jgi:hypothetical protein